MSLLFCVDLVKKYLIFSKSLFNNHSQVKYLESTLPRFLVGLVVCSSIECISPGYWVYCPGYSVGFSIMVWGRINKHSVNIWVVFSSWCTFYDLRLCYFYVARLQIYSRLSIYYDILRIIEIKIFIYPGYRYTQYRIILLDNGAI